MTSKNLLFGLIGLEIGSVGGFFGAKLYLQKKYQEQYDRDIAEMEEYYGRTDEYKREKKEREEALEDESSDGSESRENGILPTEKRIEIKEKLVNNYNQTTNYAALYQKYNQDGVSIEVDSAETEHPMDDNEEDEMIYGSSEAAQMNEEHRYNIGKAPKIITAEQASEIPAPYETKTLYYYNIDDVLVEEDGDNPIDDIQLLVGDALDKFDFRNSEEGLIFVQNFDLDTVYEIQKVWASWEDEQR